MVWQGLSPSYKEIRAEIDTIPVIDAHEHWTGICSPDPELDILATLVTSNYYPSDLRSASADYRIQEGQSPAGTLENFVVDTKQPVDARYAAWRRYHDRTCYTAYARAMLEGLRACWELDSIELDDLLAVQARMRSERDQAFADRVLAQHGIRTMVVDCCGGIFDVLMGQSPYRADLARLVLDLPQYHNVYRAEDLVKPHLEAGLARKIVTLDDYLEAFERYLQKTVDFGIVGMKDQSAYTRLIRYDNPDRGSAEAIFNQMMLNPRDILGAKQARPLQDYLFNRFLRLAARFSLTVQLHTGHMAFIRNDVAKANPVHLTSMLELHTDVTFDLFHGGWPYLGEYLFLGKNYPNVNLNMCWANEIDPAFSVEFFQRALQTVPHSKISAYGGDATTFEKTIGSLILARDNLAIALSGLVDAGWLGQQDALEVARAMLFDNPNRLFGLECV